MYYNHYSMIGYGYFNSPLFLLGLIWFVVTLVLKGYALWHASKRNDMWWFIALLVLNTLGILELVYIIFFLKNWPGKPQVHHHNHTDHTHHSA